MNSMQSFGPQNVFYVVEHKRNEKELKPEKARVKQPECKRGARNVFYNVEHMAALVNNSIISKE